jgi:type III pantothenate kinase
MVLVDIGNTNYHVWQNGKIIHLKNIKSFNDEVYYISVNAQKEKKLLKLNPDAVNLKNFVKFDTDYKGLGIDRIMACKSIYDGVVVDAGSAVTIDIMEKGIHKGGIITLGLYAFKKAFGTISEVLKYDYKIINEKLPLNTNEALNYGSVGAVTCLIKKYSFNKNIYITGGDGKFLAEILNAEYIEDLVFRGMLLTIKELKVEN